MGRTTDGAVIMVRVTPEDHDRWLAVFEEDEELRREFGITRGPIYKDVSNPASMLVHLDAEDLERAQGYFADQRFKTSAERAGRVEREVYVGKRQ